MGEGHNGGVGVAALMMSHLLPPLPTNQLANANRFRCKQQLPEMHFLFTQPNARASFQFFRFLPNFLLLFNVGQLC